MKDINNIRHYPASTPAMQPDGSISTEGVKALTRHLIAKGVKGVYVGGSFRRVHLPAPGRAQGRCWRPS